MIALSVSLIRNFIVVDFSQLLQQQDQPAPIEPRELFASLTKNARGYGYLRDVQAQVLEAWHALRDEADLVIKVNTGAGKTIDGLVILQSYLNAGEGPALYVAPDKYLVDQVQAEAHRIGIHTTDDPDSAKYINGEVIAVVNAAKLFNGLSVFSDARPSSAGRIRIGSVVIDDAHAVLSIMQQQLSLTLPRTHAAYGRLLELFEADLRKQDPSAYLDVSDASYAALAVVPFWAWRSNIEAVRQILHAERRTNELRYTWPAVRDVLELCRAVFSGNQLTITPPLPPVHHITSFSEAAHRVYMTATLADNSVLVSEFGAKANSVAQPITPKTAGDIGERMILAPLTLNPGLEVDALRQSMANLASNRNVVVLVPSTKAAQPWAAYAKRIVHAPEVAQTVEDLRKDKQFGLVVFVNKYDGIDLPDDACHVLIIDGLPEVQTPDERVEALLHKAMAHGDERQVQRIEQGMGRGVRSNDDHCVVLLIGPRLSQLVNTKATLARFTPATRAQLELSQMVAKALGEEPALSDILTVVNQALNRDTSWVTAAKRALASIAPAQGAVSPVAIGRRAAFEAAYDRNYPAAEQELSKAIQATTDVAEVGWLQEQQARYVDQMDPARAQNILVSARNKNRSVLRPLTGIAYIRISPSAGQAQTLSEYLTARYETPAELVIGYKAVADALQFNPDSTDDFEEAMQLLAEHLGFKSQRPDHDRGEGPDNLWSLGSLTYWVIEDKSGATTPVISKRDVNQLSGSLNWFRDNYDSSVSATPIMVHPSTKLAANANAPDGMAIIDEEKLDKLRTAAVSLAEALALQEAWRRPADIDGLLVGHQLRASDLKGYLKRPR